MTQLLAGLILSLTSPCQEVDPWEKVLKNLFDATDRPVVVWVPKFQDARKVSVPTKNLPVKELAKRLAWYLDVEVATFGESVLLRQKDPVRDVYGDLDIGGLTEWLSGLPQSEIDKLAKGCDYHDLDEKSQRVLAYLGSESPGLRSKMENNEPVHVQIQLQPLIRYKTETYSDVMPLESSWNGFDAKEHSLPERPVPASFTPDPKITRSKDAIDLGEGSFITTYDLIKKLRTSFRTNIVTDERLTDQKLFCKGKIEKEELESLLLNLLTVKKPEVVPTTRKNRWQTLQTKLGKMVKDVGPVGDIPAEDFANGKVLTGKDLSSRFADRASSFKNLDKTNPNGYQLSFGVAIRLRAPGSTTSQNSTGTIDGKPSQTLDTNSRSFIITP